MESQSVDQIYNNVLHPRLHVVVKVASIMASERICAAVSRECQIQGQVGIYLAMRFSGLLMVISFSASLSYSPMQRCAFHSCSSSLSLYTYPFPLYYILICIRKSVHMDRSARIEVCIERLIDVQSSSRSHQVLPLTRLQPNLDWCAIQIFPIDNPVQETTCSKITNCCSFRRIVPVG
jgi:hypothetical protein